MYSLLKRSLLLIFAVVITSSVSFSQNDDMKMSHDNSNEKSMEKSMEPVGVKTDEGMLYGKSIDSKMTITEYADLMKNPSASNETVVAVKRKCIRSLSVNGLLDAFIRRNKYYKS